MLLSSVTVPGSVADPGSVTGPGSVTDPGYVTDHDPVPVTDPVPVIDPGPVTDPGPDPGSITDPVPGSFIYSGSVPCRSLPEEQAKAQLAQCLQSPTEPLSSPEALRAELHMQPAGVPASEPRKSRVRERRREGRSKTYDWSEFRTGQTTDPMDLSSTLPSSSSSSSSTTTTSSSSYSSSTASSPCSTTSSPQTSSSAPPPQISTATGIDEGGKEQVCCPDQGHIAGGHVPNTVTVTMTTTLNAASTPQSVPPSDLGVMEVDGQGEAVSEDGSRSGVEREEEQDEDRHVEIEEQWHQVETTPLREEKQVPIATATTVSTNQRPPRELATLLNKEVGSL